ncbi:hypothetical protein CLHUN_00660 [Ruminiclostridium hungatei]|uniref:Uncharacterized protein n=1 Tax=Ruminiclostridium hungatei TaxID=48256 RepID=A0A1V4SQV0_RUMHU|nr:hypothetical protein [Ruminiclostridium hungatei]OPX46250.1 hypothetical protein CLHUN_00660 [Ruminiclostridium hungatei]
MFEMEVDKLKKVFTIVAAGFFSMQEGIDFMNEYRSKAAQIVPEEYTLIVDGREVKTSAQDVAEQLKNMIMLYMSVPFKKRIIVQQQSAVAASQTKRLAKDIPGFETIIFVESTEEAFAKA